MAERKTVYRWWWVWNFDAEERWLNEMAMQGWALVSVGVFRYTFERCEPEEHIGRAECRIADQDYISFVEETGAEYIGRCLHWIYFRRKSELGSFELLSDIDSQMKHLRTIFNVAVAAGILNIVLGIINLRGVHNLGWINLLVSTLPMYAAGRIKGRMDALEKERQLRE